MAYVETLRELVAIPSPTGEEAAIATYAEDRCRGYGHAVTRLGNSVAVHIPGIDASKAFILNGHLDTVPLVDIKDWKTEPFSLTSDPNDSNILYGLGSSDTKAGDAIMLEIAAETAGAKPPRDIWQFYTSGEEEHNQGAKDVTGWFAQHHKEQYQTIGGLILEPTVDEDGVPFIGVGHRTGLKLEVTAEGHDGHGSQQVPDGATAIEKLSRFITLGLPFIRADWEAKYTHKLLGSPTLNPTDLHAGIGKHNIIPRSGKLTFDMRTTPALNTALPQILPGLSREYGVNITSPWEPLPTICPSDAYIYAIAQVALPEVRLAAFPAATDLFAFLQHNMPMLIYGPGLVGAMHRPKESVRISDILRCAKDIERIIKLF